VRVNLLCLALTALFGRSLPAVLAEVMTPLGASDTWSWHGYRDSFIDIAGERVPVVSGGAHWGGGLWMSAADLALVGQLYLRGGEPLLDSGWVAESWRPCDLKPEYGYLWWLNDRRRIVPEAPATGRVARGNGGRHLLWVDPARDLVVVSHWGEDVGQLLAEVSAAV
jgi:CubicO group peptidase (beta-lactamase class C family)